MAVPLWRLKITKIKTLWATDGITLRGPRGPKKLYVASGTNASYQHFIYILNLMTCKYVAKCSILHLAQMQVIFFRHKCKSLPLFQ